MSAFQKKAEAQTKEIIGQMLGDGELIEEARAEYREAAGELHAGGHHQSAVDGGSGQEQLRTRSGHRARPGSRTATSPATSIDRAQQKRAAFAAALFDLRSLACAF